MSLVYFTLSGIDSEMQCSTEKDLHPIYEHKSVNKKKLRISTFHSCRGLCFRVIATILQNNYIDNQIIPAN